MSTEAEASLIGTTIAGRYTITEQICSDGLVRLYNAIRVDEPSEQVTLKLILQKDLSDRSQVFALRNEAMCLGQLSHANILACYETGLIKPFEIPQISQGGYFLVTESVQGQSLSMLYPNGCDKLEDFFEIASSLCSALDHVHSKRMRINNVNPASILVEQCSQRLKIVDFSGASMLPMDDPSLGIANGIELYDERTFVIASSFTSDVQCRDDLYGLGCVLYKLLMGCLPSLDYELRDDLPTYLVRIIDGLISPDISKRYHSSLGILIDINEAKKVFRLGRSKISFLGINFPHSFGLELSQRDIDDVCRDMSTTYQNARLSHSQLNIALISSNVSLKPIMNKLSNDWKREQAYVLHLNFAANAKQFSFWTFAESINDFIVEVISLYPHMKNRFQENIKNHLGLDAISLLCVVPALRSLVKCENIKNQFETAIFEHFASDCYDMKKLLIDLLFCFTPENKPLVILVESLHDADLSFLDLFKSISHKAKGKQLFIVASGLKAYMESTITIDLPLSCEIKHLDIDRLSMGQMVDFVGDYLRFDGDFEQDLIELIYTKSHGDRRYLCNILRGAIAHQSLWFDEEKKSWCYNLSDLKTALFDLQDLEVKQFKMMNYDRIERTLIEFAAVLGNRFSLDWLRFLDGTTSIQVLRALDSAISDGLILAERDSGGHNLFGPVYRFANGYIRDQIVSSIPKSKRVVWYQIIAPMIAHCLHESIHPSVNLFLGNCVFEFYSKFIFDSCRLHRNVCLQHANSLVLASHVLCDYSAFAKAEQFLKLAQKILSLTSEHPSINECHQRISEHLGDVYLVAGEYQNASAALSSVFDLSFGNQNNQKSKLFKLAYANLLNPNFNGTVDINQTLGLLGLPRVSELVWRWWQSLVTILIFAWQGSKIARRLLARAKMEKVAKPDKERRVNALDFYHLGTSLYRISNLKTAIKFQTVALNLTKKISYNSEAALKLIADQVVMLDRLGFHHAANKIQSFVLREAKAQNMPFVTSYMVLNRILFTDNNKINLISLDGIMPKYLADLEGGDDKLLQAEVLIFEVYRHLLLLNFERQEYYFYYLFYRFGGHQRIFYRGLAAYLLGLLLKGQKQEIVKYVRYCRVNSNRLDSLEAIYLEILKAIIGLASGKANASGQCYEKILRLYGSINVTSINPHTHDFIMLFVSLFPPLYQSEFGLSVMNKAAYDMEYRRAFKSVRSRRFYKRSILRLGRAIFDEYLNTRSKQSSYQKVVSQARSESNAIVAAFALFLQLRHQYQFKGKLDSKNLSRLYTFVRKHRCRAIELLILRTFKFEHINRWTELPEVRSTNISSKEPLHQLHIDSLALLKASFDNELSANLAFQQSMGLLANYFDFKTAELVFDNSLSSLSTLRYKQKYFDFDRQSFLAGHKDLCSVTLIKTFELSKFRSVGTDLTHIIKPQNKSSHIEQMTLTHGYDSEQETKLLLPDSRVDSDHQQDSAIVPIMFGKSRLAVLLVHGIKMGRQDAITEDYFELFRFGSFMAVWLGFKFGISASKQGLFARYQAQGGFFETCHWLDIWREGVLSPERVENTHWHLGLVVGPDRYIALHAGFDGDVTIRDQVSEDFWWAILAMRNVIANKEHWGLKDWLEECSSFCKAQGLAAQLTRLHLSFSVFERDSRRVLSCQMGDWRPIHIGSKVKATLAKHRFLSIGKDKLVPYTLYCCENMTGGVSLLARNISLAEQQILEVAYQQTRGLGHWTQNKLALKNSLKENIAASQNTGYFLAACFKAKSSQNNVKISKAS